ncbi:MAG TPA: hypothetical protein VLB74_02190 [Flavobacterium sp.]|uniref:hypothetical protein n=1 Tax=Flavobacterium sp. TaxID=239 RepID=UPI002C32566B|nr:hypothetical protein [Flavobacterium sp.]HSD13440.1 hypothetical protein [Flavobacterium sp.]
MEPNKMEEEFRKKLNEREIQPSDAAWDRLDAMLSVAENKKPKGNYRWLYIAAGLALFFSIGLFLFQQEKGNPEIQMKNSTVVKSNGNEKNSPESDSAISKEIVSDFINETAVAENSSALKTKAAKNTTKEEVINTNQHITKEEFVNVTVEKEQEVQKVAPEAEKLLANADLSKEKPQVKVNANSLLNSVEGELNHEFRETTLQRLNRNFKTVRTAVANRNYE